LIKCNLQELILFEDESITIHNALFDKISRKLVFEKTNVINKKDQGNLSSTLDLNGFPPSKIVQINRATREALKMFVGEMESENVILKDIIK